MMSSRPLKRLACFSKMIEARFFAFASSEGGCGVESGSWVEMRFCFYSRKMRARVSLPPSSSESPQSSFLLILIFNFIIRCITFSNQAIQKIPNEENVSELQYVICISVTRPSTFQGDHTADTGNYVQRSFNKLSSKVRRHCKWSITIQPGGCSS